MRAPEKRTFYINVGQIPSNEVENFMQKTINTMKKTPYVGADGQYNLRFNMQNMMEDFYIPVRGGDNVTRVETTPGLNYDGITDIRYYQEKLFSALKIPKAYLGYEGELCVVPETEIPLLDGTTKTLAAIIQDNRLAGHPNFAPAARVYIDNSGKATLSAEVIRFARTVERVQRIIESELTKIAIVHLYTQGFTGESLSNFKIKLTTPSVLFEQEKIALLKEKVDLAGQMLDTRMFSTDYIYESIFGISEEDYSQMRNLVGGSDRYGQHELHGGYPSDYSNLMEAEATGSHNVDIFDDPIRARMLEDSGILEREPTMLKESNIAKIEGMLKRLDIPDKLVNKHSK